MGEGWVCIVVCIVFVTTENSGILFENPFTHCITTNGNRKTCGISKSCYHTCSWWARFECVSYSLQGDARTAAPQTTQTQPNWTFGDLCTFGGRQFLQEIWKSTKKWIGWLVLQTTLAGLPALRRHRNLNISTYGHEDSMTLNITSQRWTKCHCDHKQGSNTTMANCEKILKSLFHVYF